MCGIAGVLNLTQSEPVAESVLHQMLAQIRHRGPDGTGIYRDPWAGLGSTRLSIIDLSGGWQPIGNEDGTLWIVFNGEIFNYVELRPQLEARGHRFTTHTDTEVILHLYEDFGPDCLGYLNGQFVLAIWDAAERELFLARDRVGIRPLFYTCSQDKLIFGSEVKSILAYPGISAQIDPTALEEVFTYWSVQSPRSIFKGVLELPSAHYLRVKNGQIAIRPYWELDFHVEDRTRRPELYLEELEALLIDSTRIRLRADVPVGAYLSGGLDSSVTAAIVRNYTANHLDTFSIAFEDQEFDESAFQLQMAAKLGTEHHVVRCTHADISRVFPDVIWHTETPVLRTAPAPMFLLSELVHGHNFKVVLTGEGADEFLAGYDIFKEMKVRRFWARQPESKLRPLLLKRLYPDIAALSSAGGAYLAAFFKKNLDETGSPYYSHAIRWSNGSRLRRFLAGRAGDEPERPALPAAFAGWSPLAQAQYLEVTTFMSPYLLSSQGDRMAMAHSVEGRFPFLDYRLIEFCNRLPAGLKMYGLTEKWLLKQLGRRFVPQEILHRAKRPYRAPIHRSFFGGEPAEYVRELLSEEALAESGLFEPGAVTQLSQKAGAGMRLSEVEDMALAGVLSTQLVHHQFVTDFKLRPIRPADCLKSIDHTSCREMANERA